MVSREDLLRRDERSERVAERKERCDTQRMVADEEDILQLPDGTFDLVMSSMALCINFFLKYSQRFVVS